MTTYIELPLLVATLVPSNVTDTDSIALTVSLGVLSGATRLSSNAADAGYTVVPIDIQSSNSVGLRAQVENSSIRALFSGDAPVDYDDATGEFSMAEASAADDGYLSASDWTTFNDKEPEIAAGTTAEYWRGDKTFQTLNIAAIQSITDGSAASSGQLWEDLSTSQESNTVTGVGSTGTWGAVTSQQVPAGRYILIGDTGFHANGATLTDSLQCGISDSATGVGINEFDTTVIPGLVGNGSDWLAHTPFVYVHPGSTTTYYLNTKFTYSAGTPQHRGRIRAYRVG